ncbi:Uncharacterized protein SCF082_LOCUS47511, partial [Durusdinium trenchii]
SIGPPGHGPVPSKACHGPLARSKEAIPKLRMSRGPTVKQNYGRPGQEGPVGYNSQQSSGPVRVLCCIWGELRAVLATAGPLREMVLDPLNADLLILAQHHFADDEHRLAVLSATGRVVYAEVYEKPEPGSFFGEDHYELMMRVKGNWLNPGNSQVLINHKLLSECIKSRSLYEKYDLFVFSRSDMLHLLPFPTASSLLQCVGRGDVLTQAGHEFGGVNYNFAIMRREEAERYLCAPYDTI